MRARAQDHAVPEPFIRSLELDRARIADATVYPFSIPSLARFETLELHPQVTFPTQSELGDMLRLVRGARHPRSDFFLRADAFFNVASELESLDPCVAD
jgi:predicted ATPase